MNLDRFQPIVLDDVPAYEGIMPLYEFEHNNELYNVEVFIKMLSGCRVRHIRFVSITLLDDEWGDLKLNERLVSPSFEEAVISKVCEMLED